MVKNSNPPDSCELFKLRATYLLGGFFVPVIQGKFPSKENSFQRVAYQ
ncbi:hypothetical protein VCR17J2_900053 [Vibrio coralliirubri]|nr:hypothetical protein VCR17J2_900053 [Vibrio coralliirubri]